MSPHQHGEVGIGVFEIRFMSRVFTRQDSTFLFLLVQMRKFIDGIIAFSSSFTDVADSSSIGLGMTVWILDHAAKFRIAFKSRLSELLLHELSSVGRK